VCFPLDVKKSILNDVSSVRWVKLAFPVDMDIALCAGIENAIGDFVLLLRPLVEPINIIEGMVREGLKGCDVVIGIANRPRTLGYKLARLLSNKLLLSINYHIPKGSTPVRCLSRRAINTVLSTGKIKHQFFIKVSNSGYSTLNYKYKLLNPNALKKRTLLSGISQGMHLMIFNSTQPLRWISLLGVFGSLSSFLFAVYSIVINILRNNVTEGWTSMVFFSSFLFMILFIILAFLGEYMARLLNENDNKKSYDIFSEESSSVMMEVDRLNVMHKS
jgi:small basic protein